MCGRYTLRTPVDPLVETFEIDEYPSSLIPNCNVAPTQEVEKIYSGSGKLAGKAATITGGDSGSGRVVALDCTWEAAGVVISYLESEKPDAQETIRAVENSGKKTFAVPNDIQDGAYCQQIVEQAVFESGKIDVLVNNTASNLAGVS